MTSPSRRLAYGLAATAVATLSACAGHAHHGMHAGAHASTTLAPLGTATAKGKVMFMQRDDGVEVHAHLSGLKPNAEHGFHVHEKGDCSAPDGTSAGGHFNPGGQPHGKHGSGQPHHGGDMPNLRTDAAGNAMLKVKLSGVTVTAGPGSVVGRSVIVHANPDDYSSQPAGNSGPRIACGVIAGS